MRPVGSDFTHGTEPRLGPTQPLPAPGGGTYPGSYLYAGAWDHTSYRALHDQLSRLRVNSKTDKLIDAATDMRRFFRDHRNRPSRTELNALRELLERIDSPALWYAYALGLHERSFKIFNGGIKNLYLRELESLPAPPLKEIVEEIAESRDKDAIKGMKKELQIVRSWVMEHHKVFGSGHQTELTELIGKLGGDVKDVFFTNAILAEIGENLSNLRNGNRFFKNIASFFTRKVYI